jgi:hypothetical protein
MVSWVVSDLWEGGFSTLNVETVCSSERSSKYRFAQRYKSKDQQRCDKNLIMQLTSSLCYFVSRRSTYSPEHLFSNTLNLCSLLRREIEITTEQNCR